METNQAIQKIEREIQAIKAKLLELGPMRPGSVSAQYNVCGKPGCRCKDPQTPRRHGPYYQLNYVYQGKKKSQFIRRENLKQVRQELATYKKFRQLTDQWIGLALQAAQLSLKSPLKPSP
jgi:hypothetical protein